MAHSYHVDPEASKHITKLAARLETVKARRTMRADLDSIFSQVATPATRTAGLNALHTMLARVCLGNDPKDAANLRMLQDDTKYNVVSRFIPLLAKVVWVQPDMTLADGSPVNLHRTRPESLAMLAEQTEQMLNVIQGLCLMHEKTRSMFKREENMKIILRLLEDPSKINSKLLGMALDTLTAILVGSSENIRLFERIGMTTVTKLLENCNVNQCTRLKCIEFLYFYLIPEESCSQPNIVETPSPSGAVAFRIKTPEEKRELLKKYLPIFARIMTTQNIVVV